MPPFNQAGPPAQHFRLRAVRMDKENEMKPKWIRTRKREKKARPGSMLQTGMLLFSATCGATLFLAACNSN